MNLSQHFDIDRSPRSSIKNYFFPRNATSSKKPQQPPRQILLKTSDLALSRRGMVLLHSEPLHPIIVPTMPRNETCLVGMASSAHPHKFGQGGVGARGLLGTDVGCKTAKAAQQTRAVACRIRKRGYRLYPDILIPRTDVQRGFKGQHPNIYSTRKLHTSPSIEKRNSIPNPPPPKMYVPCQTQQSKLDVGLYSSWRGKTPSRTGRERDIPSVSYARYDTMWHCGQLCERRSVSLGYERCLGGGGGRSVVASEPGLWEKKHWDTTNGFGASGMGRKS